MNTLPNTSKQRKPNRETEMHLLVLCCKVRDFSRIYPVQDGEHSEDFTELTQAAVSGLDHLQRRAQAEARPIGGER